ncbi:hypothetical protein EV193_103667 [Herbihabitans rhizosphaerae]|uniref:DUF8083 domain-containing protein n=1 Tax=Herbihabitans rhizosphaerae TaxID=1872711 RepID=A0A4Q7KX25_9PSEU|nr:hypothetical protein EV193_103667 [Herbihabitans rhizosphaerae]
MWLKSQFSLPASLFPGELPDGRALPPTPNDVLVLDPAVVPVEEGTTVGPGPLVCPLDVRTRSAAALVGFLSTATPTLREAALPASVATIRKRATEVLSGQSKSAVHVVSMTWTVPLPWFSMVDPDRRHVVVATRDDPARTCCWRIAIVDARKRIDRAHALAVDTFGDEGPTKILADTDRWLANFDEASAVELDYGGLVQLLDDDELVGDTSAQDVNAIVDALENGDAEEVAERFERLRDFWGELALRERFN